jgi:hypothetical protein
MDDFVGVLSSKCTSTKQLGLIACMLMLLYVCQSARLFGLNALQEFRR